MPEQPPDSAMPPVAPPPLPPRPVLPLDYANPVAHTYGIGRLGDLIVADDGSDLGGLCVKCAADGTKRYTTKYSWCPAWYYLLLPAGVLLVAIIISIISKRGTVSYSLCKQHYARRVKLMLMTWVLVLAVPVTIFAGIVLASMGSRQSRIGEPIAIAASIACVGLFVAAAIVGNRARPFTPKRIDAKPRTVLQLKGAGPAFLDTLPGAYA